MSNVVDFPPRSIVRATVRGELVRRLIEAFDSVPSDSWQRFTVEAVERGAATWHRLNQDRDQD